MRLNIGVPIQPKAICITSDSGLSFQPVELGNVKKPRLTYYKL